MTDRGDETVHMGANFGVDDLDISSYGGGVEVHCDKCPAGDQLIIAIGRYSPVYSAAALTIADSVEIDRL